MTLRLVPELDFGVVYEAMEKRMPPEEWAKISKGVLTKEIFIKYCRDNGYPSRGIEYDGKQIGGVVFDGNAMHIEILPEYHGRWSLLIPELGRWVFSVKDPIQVAVSRHEPKINRFMMRNNWPRIAENEDTITYEMSSRTMPLFDKRVRSGQ